MGRHNRAGCLPNGPPFVDGNRNKNPSYKKSSQLRDAVRQSCVTVPPARQAPLSLGVSVFTFAVTSLAADVGVKSIASSMGFFLVKYNIFEGSHYRRTWWKLVTRSAQNAIASSTH